VATGSSSSTVSPFPSYGHRDRGVPIYHSRIESITEEHSDDSCCPPEHPTRRLPDPGAWLQKHTDCVTAKDRSQNTQGYKSKSSPDCKSGRRSTGCGALSHGSFKTGGGRGPKQPANRRGGGLAGLPSERGCRNPGKFKQGILRRYLDDSYDHHVMMERIRMTAAATDTGVNRRRNASGSLSSRDYEEEIESTTSLSPRSTPLKEDHRCAAVGHEGNNVKLFYLLNRVH